MNKIFGVIICLIVLITGINAYSSLKIDVVNDCKVIETQSQMHVSKNGTDYRYLVITEKETFICESSILNGKFNNSDEFFRIKKDSTYIFKVAGIGKSFLFDYRNILEVNPKSY